MKSLLKLFLVCLSAVVVLPVFSDIKDRFPKFCVPINFRFQQHMLLLNTASKEAKPRLFLIHNVSGINLWLNHPVVYPSASAGWASYIMNDHWSAISLNKMDFSITCSQLLPGVVKAVFCDKQLHICEATSAQFNTALDGTYWVAENLPLPALIKKIQERGIAVQ